MNRMLSLIFAVAALIALAPVDTFACACCAERGSYYVTKGSVKDYDLEMLSGMKFDAVSHLFLDAAGFEIITGLDELRKAYESETGEPPDFDKIALAAAYGSKAWTMNFDAGSGMKGSLVLTVPAEMETFKIDIHDGRGGGAGGPLLYKELRFRGKTGSASGIFAGSAKAGTAYTMIFQGRGNFCDNSEDFTHWRLDFDDESADYTFFGKMASGNKEYFFGNAVEPSGPKFEDYAVEVTATKPRAVNLKSHKDARMFRTRLREAWSEGVNFAGRYIFTYWGCGTNCVIGAIIDAKTGSVYFPDELAGMGFGLPGANFEEDEEVMEYRKDSSLLIIRGALANSETPGTTWMVWKGTGFEQAKFLPAVPGGSDLTITSDSAGEIRIGMTFAEIEKLLPGTKFTRGPGEGEDEIEATSDGIPIFYFSAAESGDDYESPIDPGTRITGIVVLDPRYRTADGIRNGMTVALAETILGKVKEIMQEGLTGDEYAIFTDHPRGIRIQIGRPGNASGPEELAGLYPNGKYTTARYVPGAVIKTISVVGSDIG